MNGWVVGRSNGVTVPFGGIKATAAAKDFSFSNNYCHS